MSSVVVAGDTSGSVTISAPAVSGSSVLTLPAVTDTLVGLAATQTLTNKSIVATQLTGTVAAARLPAGSVVQVVSTTKTDTFTTTSSSFTDVTGLSVSITPSSASNKILVLGSVNYGASADVGFFRLVRDSTALQVGDAASTRLRATAQQRNANDSADAEAACVNFLDSPSTTSSVTYKIQALGNGYTLRFNSSADDADQINRGRTASTITVMEIKG